jgi:hypothetical protein
MSAPGSVSLRERGDIVENIVTMTRQETAFMSDEQLEETAEAQGRRIVDAYHEGISETVVEELARLRRDNAELLNKFAMKERTLHFATQLLQEQIDCRAEELHARGEGESCHGCDTDSGQEFDHLVDAGGYHPCCVWPDALKVVEEDEAHDAENEKYAERFPYM